MIPLCFITIPALAWPVLRTHFHTTFSSSEAWLFLSCFISPCYYLLYHAHSIVNSHVELAVSVVGMAYTLPLALILHSKRRSIDGFIVLVNWCAMLAHMWGLIDEFPLVWVMYQCIDNLCWICYWAITLLLFMRFIPPICATQPIIIQRKWFHGLVIILFLPPIMTDGTPFLTLCMGVALCILFLLESVHGHPFFSRFWQFMSQFMDKRDQGEYTVSHIYLLLGCALPVFASAFVPFPHVFASSGIIILGLGDSMATICGYYFGKRRWSSSSSKTMKGSFAAWISVVPAMLCIAIVTAEVTYSLLYNIALSTLLTCLLEAWTSHIDNLLLPLCFMSNLLIWMQCMT